MCPCYTCSLLLLALLSVCSLSYYFVNFQVCVLRICICAPLPPPPPSSPLFRVIYCKRLGLFRLGISIHNNNNYNNIGKVDNKSRQYRTASVTVIHPLQNTATAHIYLNGDERIHFQHQTSPTVLLLHVLLYKPMAGQREGNLKTWGISWIEVQRTAQSLVSPKYCQWPPFSWKNHLVGLVVKASTSRAEDPGFESWQDFFSGLSHTSDLKIGTSVPTLPGAWRSRVSPGTDRPGVSILWLGEVESLICNFCLSVAACKIVWADPSLRYTSMLLGR